MLRNSDEKPNSLKLIGAVERGDLILFIWKANLRRSPAMTGASNFFSLSFGYMYLINF